jgi:glycosyltransferase involved in cell wall biosynthesis
MYNADRKMRVWIIEIGEPLPVVDGSFRDFRVGMLAESLVDYGHEIVWWASTFNHLNKKHRFDSSCTIEPRSGLQIRLLHGPGYGRNASLQRFLHHRVVANAFASEASKAPSVPDVIFCCLPTLELPEKAVAFGQEVGIPVVVDVRDLWPDHYLTLVPKRVRGLLKLALLSEFRRVRRIMKGASGITAISNSFLTWALNYAERKKQPLDGVFPMGYPTSSSLPASKIKDKQEQLISAYKINSDHLIVTFVGTFCSSYALETVIEAARILDQAGQRDVQFILVGDGDNGRKLRSQAQGLCNVIFTGWFDQSSIFAILGISSVGLAPYHTNASMSLPNKPFEYMSGGLPLLSSLPGELETLIYGEKVGLQYQAEDVDSLVEKIRWFAARPDARRDMGTRARKLFDEQFSAEVIYPRLVQHLEKVVLQVRNVSNC